MIAFTDKLFNIMTDEKEIAELGDFVLNTPISIIINELKNIESLDDELLLKTLRNYF
jgi:hypothetical protein